jgi:hypothetical protein
VTRASKAEVKRRSKAVRETLRELELALFRSTSAKREAEELERALQLASRAFEQARSLEYAVRALLRSRAAAAARRERVGAS